MADDPDNSLEGSESLEDDSLPTEGHEDEEEEEEEEAPETSTSSASKKKAKKNKKKSKKKKSASMPVEADKSSNHPVDIPDPYSTSSSEMAVIIGLIDVEVDYELPEFKKVTSLKAFSIAVRPYILYRNPGTIVAKMYPLIQSKYKEFQDYMAEKGTPIQKQQRQQPLGVSIGPLDQSGPLVTRKSARRKRGDGDGRGGNDSDQEFEMLIKQHEKEQDKIEEDKEKQRQVRATAKVEKKKMALETARATIKALREQGGSEEHHNDRCEECGQSGELVLCDSCPRVYHVVCIDDTADKAPEGEWSCRHCEEFGPELPVVEEKPVNVHMDYCKICHEKGNILQCSKCPNSYHAYCLHPSLTEIPKDEWYCPRCLVKEPPHKVERILTWRWVEIKYPPPIEIKDGDVENPDDLYLKPPRAMEPRKEKEFFVKWRYLSYWQCEWLSETEMDVNFAALVRMYWRKVDLENPPMFDESTVSCHHKDNDPYHLRERFYQYGVKPEWMQIQRIVNHVSYGKSQQDYLVKWRELAYDQSTWERDDTDYADYETAIVKYWNHRERILGNEDIPKNVIKMIAHQRELKGLPAKSDDSHKKKRKEKIDIRKKWEAQPDYVTETGGKLHPYQLEGINWLRHSWSNGTDAILADEMGLGKTVQSLSFLYSLMKEGHTKGPFLVAAPLSTIINWEREAEQWCPDFYVVTYVGDQNSRAVIRENEFSFMENAVNRGPKVSKLKSQENLKFHVLLTSYEIINMDKAILSSINWAALVVDEAHRLKNNQSTFFKNLRDYHINYRVLLTGTPLQNNLEELFHLLNFLSPDRFNELENFTAEFSEISKEDQIDKLHNLLGPHMLRRLKADVLTGMPSKSELIVRVELSPMQKKYYKNILTRNFEALNVKSGGAQMSLINIIMELKKCCNHPYLFAKASLEAPKIPNGMYERNALIKNAGKFMLLQKMMRKLKEGGHRVLIFSQMTMMLDILEDFCDLEGYAFERIDGGVTGQMRQNAIDRFNAPGAQQFVFLLSTRAGGLGINLATADTVIIYDSDWNPHNDIQAFSRAHRLGQKHKVMIYRFVTKNSVEERITSVAKKKMLLNHLVVRAGLGAKDGKSMSKTELDDVLRWGTEELFKDEEPAAEPADGEGTSDSTNAKKSEQEIVWDDAAVDFLLDRNKEEEAQDGEKKEHWTNEYLSSFKVATYNTKEADDEDDLEDETEVINQGTTDADPNYWEKLLKHHYEHDQETEQEQLGKGKRQRRQINYATDKVAPNVIVLNTQKDEEEEDYDPEYASENEEAHSDDDFEENRRRSRRENTEVLPPLHAKVNGNVEVLGFSTRQRKAFLNAIMRWGMPPEDLSHTTIWQVRDLKNKSEKVFRAYAALFMRHLCEPWFENSDTFSDGIPREGLQRQAVLGRLGMLAILHKKVQEFEAYNGDWSMPHLVPVAQPQAAEQQPLNTASPTNFQSASGPQSANAESENIDVDVVPVDVPKLTSATQKRIRPPPIKFNICDGGFSELHNLWTREERAATKGKEYEIWNRRHDYWLLHAAAFYGYGRYQVNFQEIANDPKYAIINEPFKAHSDAEAAAFGDAKYKFLQQRFKLLEQAMVIEEQLRRAAHVGKQDAPEEIGQLAQNFSILENTADAHATIAEHSHDGDRNANVVLHNVLATLNNILDNMRTDMHRLPALGNFASVTDRLQMSERQTLSRLIPGQTPKTCPLPPSGPFVVPSRNQKLPTIQPRIPLLFRQALPQSPIENSNQPSTSTPKPRVFAVARRSIQRELPMELSDPNVPSTSAAGCSSSYPSSSSSYPNF